MKPRGSCQIKYNLWDIYELYGWNLVFLRNMEELEDWRTLVFDQYPLEKIPNELIVIDLWRLASLEKYEQVIEKCNDALDSYNDVIDISVPGFLYIRGYSSYYVGRHKEAIEDCELSYSMFKFFNKEREAATASNYLGAMQLTGSNYQEALKWYSRSMEYYSCMGLRQKQSMVYLHIGIMYYKIGNYKASLDALKHSLHVGIEGNWTRRQCFANIALGNVYRLTRDFEQARKHIHTAYNQAQELGFRREEALSLEFLGDVYRDEGRPEEARRFYKRALTIAMDIAPKGDIVMEIQRRMGECLTMEGDPAGASAHLTQALQMARAQGDRFEEGVTLRIVAETNVALGDLEGAIRTITDSVALLDEIGAKHELAISLMYKSELRLLRLKQGNLADDLAGAGVELDEIWADTTRTLDLFLGVDVPYWTEKARNLAQRVSHAKTKLEQERKTAELAKAGGYDRYGDPDVIIHTSGVMRDLIEICDMFAGSGDPVLISGETGTGKELIARRVHYRSARRDKPLVTVNVAAIASTMFEREFFGHVKGSFSGADCDSKGFAASAHGGTLFLDEIGELPRDMQPKLLRLIQDGTYQAIGDPHVRHADIRLVAATNADLSAMVEQGKFRSDLYFRLKVLELNVPPVRERREDILTLLRHFLGLAAGRPVEPVEYFNRLSLDRLLTYDWPGNVREIAMVARRAVMEMKVKGRVCMDLNQEGKGKLTLTSGDRSDWYYPAEIERAPAGKHLKSERARILLALEECGGSRIEAARKLGVGRSTLYRRMEKLGIPTRKQ